MRTFGGFFGARSKVRFSRKILSFRRKKIFSRDFLYLSCKASQITYFRMFFPFHVSFLDRKNEFFLKLAYRKNFTKIALSPKNSSAELRAILEVVLETMVIIVEKSVFRQRERQRATLENNSKNRVLKQASPKKTSVYKKKLSQTYLETKQRFPAFQRHHD